MSALLWIQGMRTPALEGFFSVATYLGDEIAVVVLMALLFWCVDRRLGLRLAAAFFLCGLLGQLAKVIFAVPRPWVLYEGIAPVESALAAATGWSFPSGHTLSAMALYGFFFLTGKRWWQKALCALAVTLVAVSRMYLGVHTPWDVLGAAVLGALGLAGAFYLANALERGGKSRQVAIGLFFGLSAATLACVFLRPAGGMEAELVRDAVKAAGVAVGFAAGLLLVGEREFSTKARLLAQVFKLALGLVGATLLQKGVPILIPGLTGAFLAYGLLGLWAAWGYPMLVAMAGKKLRRNAA